MKNTAFLLFFALFVAPLLRAQENPGYETLVCKGNIPKEFTTASTDKYKTEIGRIESKPAKKKELRMRKTFALESNFVLDDLLQSGKVLFNDEVSIYLDSVARVLTTAQPLSDKKHIRIYALRSTSVNAFASDRGDIFVTLGLLSQVENEAQLAFILSHEMAHVEAGHNISLFLESEAIDRKQSDRKILNNTVFDDKMLAKLSFSKEFETEADQKGLKRFLATNYSTETLPTVFDVLKYSNTPFDDVRFDRSMLQSDNFILPDEYWLNDIKPISGAIEDADDSNMTHPNLKTRRETLETAMKPNSNAGKTDFILSAATFFHVRELARMELPMLYLKKDKIPDALYASFLLLNQNPDNIYLKKCLLKSLYFHAKFSNDDDYDYDGDFTRIEGASQEIYHLLEKMPAQETVILALHYAWQLHQQHPEDQEITAICDDLFFELSKHFNDLSKFESAPMPSDTASKNESGRVVGDSKYDKIKQQQTAQKAPGESEYWRFAFAPWLQQEEFTSAFKKGAARYGSFKKTEDNLQNTSKRKRRNARKNGLNLGISKIVVVNPFYLVLDQRKDNAVQFLRSEEGQDHYRDLIRETSAKTDLKVNVLDVCNLNGKQTEQFNDIRFLNEYFAEQVNHYDLSLTPGYEQPRLNAIADKYGTDYFLWTGVISLREKNKYAALKIILGVIYLPTLPFLTYSAVKPKYDMLHYTILFDIRTGRRQVLKLEEFNRRDTDAIVKAHLYDSFTQIKRK